MLKSTVKRIVNQIVKSNGHVLDNPGLNPARLQVAGGATITAVLSATATLDFPDTAAGTSSDLTIAVTGATVGSAVTLGCPAAPEANTNYIAWVSAADTVTVRFNNYSAGSVNPDSGSFRVIVVIVA